MARTGFLARISYSDLVTRMTRKFHYEPCHNREKNLRGISSFGSSSGPHVHLPLSLVQRRLSSRGGPISRGKSPPLRVMMRSSHPTWRLAVCMARRGKLLRGASCQADKSQIGLGRCGVTLRPPPPPPPIHTHTSLFPYSRYTCRHTRRSALYKDHIQTYTVQCVNRSLDIDVGAVLHSRQLAWPIRSYTGI